MAEPLKNMYNRSFFEQLCDVLQQELEHFDRTKFIKGVFTKQWSSLELKERVRHITHVLHAFLPQDFQQAHLKLIDLSRAFKESKFRNQGFPLIFLADYIEVYGLDHYQESIAAIEAVTKLVSAEFAIRPFLLRYPDATMKQMESWSWHPEANVRRLSSEGCRPRLPWAQGVPQLKKDPSPILKILENLKDDPSDYVRRSVANNLNDIAKDHPQVVLSLVKAWYGKNPFTDKIVRHGCRTLLKKGNVEALDLHGFNPSRKSEILSVEFSPKRIRIGKELTVDFVFQSKEKKPALFRLEYGIEYLTRSGKISYKIFKITEGYVPPDKVLSFTRKRSFKDFTTRKHYKGKHTIFIIVNGKKVTESEFIVY